MTTDTSNNEYLDLDDLIDELDARKQLKANSDENVTYNSLLQTITQIGKMADKNDKLFPNKNQSQDLTADLFANMSDSEMISHFLPMRGIDFDQGVSDEISLEKEEKKKNEEIKQAFYADEFMPHRMMPQLNPLYHLSAFKSIVSNAKSGNNKRSKNEVSTIDFEAKKKSQVVIKEPVPPQIESEEDEDEESGLEDDEPQAKRSATRVIKKRKPRTYKYNPKPLQHKVCRSFVPDDLKDGEYWARRKRNNEAAKKSREERRKKELEILNSYELMKQEYSQIKIENIRLKARNSVLEKQVTELKCKLK